MSRAEAKQIPVGLLNISQIFGRRKASGQANSTGYTSNMSLDKGLPDMFTKTMIIANITIKTEIKTMPKVKGQCKIQRKDGMIIYH